MSNLPQFLNLCFLISLGLHPSTNHRKFFPVTLLVLGLKRKILTLVFQFPNLPPTQSFLLFSISQEPTSRPNSLLLDEGPNWILPSLLLIILGFCSFRDIEDILSLVLLFYIYNYYQNNNNKILNHSVNVQIYFDKKPSIFPSQMFYQESKTATLSD